MNQYTYNFHLGRQKDLSAAEIFTLFEYKQIHVDNQRNVGEYLLISTSTPIDATEFMNILGGTRLIGEKLNAQGDAKDTIYTYLESLPSDKKLHFSISGGKHAEKIAIDVKKKLKVIGRSVRFVKAMNTATILHNGLVERGSHLTVIDNVTYITRAIQPIEEMSERDYGRPQPDGFNGMLPPKLARMMVNLTSPEKNDVLLDPFCGSGTLLGEAMSLGMKQVIGSDISQKVIADSEENLSWLKKNLSSNAEYTLHTEDVRELSKTIKPNMIDVIASEPLLGIPKKGREKREFLIGQARELKSLYIHAFREFQKILKPGGRIVFVIPRFRHNEDWITIDCRKQIEELGFEILPYNNDLDMPLVYHRDGQHVGREIWRWKKSG
jgi:tRNA G10  N-methylase Trm11